MKKIGKALAMFAIAAFGAAPAASLQPPPVAYPQACQPEMSHILYYNDSHSPGQWVTGAEVHWCDDDVTYLGGPDVISWTEWCDPC